MHKLFGDTLFWPVTPSIKGRNLSNSSLTLVCEVHDVGLDVLQLIRPMVDGMHQYVGC